MTNKRCPNLKKIKAIGCNQYTLDKLRSAIDENGQTNDYMVIFVITLAFGLSARFNRTGRKVFL